MNMNTPDQYLYEKKQMAQACRLILNLKNLNEDMPYLHFKMKTLQSVLSVITPGCYLASMDLKGANYSVTIHPDHTMFIKFIWKNQLFQF